MHFGKVSKRDREDSVMAFVYELLVLLGASLAKILIGIYAVFNEKAKEFILEHQYVINNLNSIENDEE